ncbi:hypothetical protein CQ12_41180 [Bradyrhizobium jicamae]|uniref:Uncharacterized protein n=1 Tax=Bradyrhizobium jicamae TaxID=280332 RepID=A0A0R3LD02_9BRAD|nr:hypothetical protein [Bradyrhizobium jicamae]KRR05745.1 hypothetical protein CQ12_41180 [Bradyrhizobium jicamae]
MVVVKNRRTLGQIFAAPIAIGALSTVGLLAALVGDGVWDAVSWLALALPILLYLFFVARRPCVGSS